MKRLLLFVLFGACASAQPATTPTIVTSIHPLYALVSELVGENARVVRLLPPGASPHTFDPTPKDVVQLAEADLVILNGGLDAWLLDLVTASGTDADVLEVMRELTFEPVSDEHESEGEGHKEERNLENINPHIWLDPILMAHAIPLIVEQLVEADPKNKDTYQSNGEALIERLTALDGELQTTLEGVQGAPFVPFHDAWPYFARRYGLQLVVEIEPSPGREPSPRYLAEALELITASGAKAIFNEAQLSPRPAEVVAENAGTRLYTLDPLGGADGLETYADLLRYNARVVAEALRD